MSTNPQWSKFQPPIMNSDPSILDFKTITSTIDDQSNYGGYKQPFETSIESIANRGSSSIFGKQSSTPPYNYNNYNGSSAMTFQMGTFSADERPNSNSTFNGDIYGSNTSTNLSGNSQFGSTNVTTDSDADSNAANQGIRETGIIEKLLHSYGFIQCCERQARLFFHFSQFSGNIEHLKIGDPVEFELSYDRRTGKPIASAVSKIAPEVVGVVMSEERVTGTVTTEIKTEGSNQELQGRISYENRGECFFLPYNKDDVEGNVTLRSGDKVSFQIAANQRGNLGACHIRLENPAHPIKYQGVVCSMKESFGFIERADVVKEIFFHFSEAKLDDGDELRLGDDVQFLIQTRNGKEVACNITRLEPGSVVFEDVCTEIVKGQVLKPLERGQHARQEDALPGRIRYRAPDHSEVEIPFGEKDQRGDFTLRHGDWVQFRIATDRRDQLQRAINISLLEESFLVSGERREQGVVCSIKDGFGFIKCADRDLRVFFHLNEVLDVDRETQVNDEVEFTIIQDSLSSYMNVNNRTNAIRIKHLPPGTVQFETLVEENIIGVITKEAQSGGSKSPTKLSPGREEKSLEPGLIHYQQGDIKKTIPYCHKDVVDSKVVPRLGDKVEFNMVQVKRNKKFLAVDVKVISGKSQKVVNGVKNGNGRTSPCQGFIAALKDGFGFIETLSHDQEVFFHFSNFDGDPEKLEICQEVEYNLGSRGSVGSCMSAENVKLLPKGSIPTPVGKGPLFDGVVIRPLRCFNPEQSTYAGLVQAVSEEDDPPEYEFGILGLANKRELLQAGDPVQFQIDSDGRATNIMAVRKKRRATVEAVKGQFGFLSVGGGNGKKLFFHITDVKDGVMLQPGDTVEFNLVTNHRNGKSLALNVTKVSDGQQRPERLISRLRTFSLEDGGKKLKVVRQPRGPDGTRGFSSSARSPRSPGAPVSE